MYSQETFSIGGFVFSEVSPVVMEAHKTAACIKFPSPDGRSMTASAVYDFYKSFFVDSCISWEHTEGKACDKVEKSKYYDECFEHAFNVAYAANAVFKARRIKRGKKLVAGSPGQEEK